MNTNSLTILGNATRMLAEVKTIDDAKQLMDMAAAAKVYAQKHKLGKEAVNHANYIMNAAEIKLGEFLAVMDMSQGAMGIGKSAVLIDDRTLPPTLTELGISKNLSSESQTLASMTDEEKEKVITGKTSKRQAVSKARRKKIAEECKESIIPDGKYRIIYADPPWKYGNNMPDYFVEQADHYPLMTIQEICDMPVKEIAENNAVLFLWVTSPMLEESFEVIKAWGFKYKSSFIWDKVKHNMGHYNSVRHELLLIAVKGSCQPDIQKLHDSVVSEERTEHSKKPETFRQIINEIYPYGKRIELFARKKAGDWDVYGNQIS